MNTVKNFFIAHKLATIIVGIIILLTAVGTTFWYKQSTTIKESSPQEVQKFLNTGKNNASFKEKTIVYFYNPNNKNSKEIQNSVAKNENKFNGKVININVNDSKIQKVIRENITDSDQAEKMINNISPTISLFYKKYEIKAIGKGSSDEHTYISNKQVNSIFSTNVKNYDNERNQQEKNEKSNEKKEADNETKNQIQNFIAGIFNTNNVNPNDFVGGEKNTAYKELKLLIPDNGVKVDDSEKNASSSVEVNCDTKMKSFKKLSNNEYLIKYLATIETEKKQLDTNEMSSKTNKNTKKIEYESKVKKDSKNKFQIISNKQIKVLSDKTKEE